MMMPNFLIIGAQKSGTTWFGIMLSRHPEVFVRKNEIHFFDKDYNYRKGLDWYKGHFPSVDMFKCVGEKTPDYLWANGVDSDGRLPEVHKNIHHHIPKCKLIVILRNPVDRAISAVRHMWRNYKASPLISMDRLLFGDKKNLGRGFGVIEMGMYYEQITAYLELFDRDQVLILIYEEDIVGNPKLGLDKACEFLGAKRDFQFPRLSQRIHDPKLSRLAMVAKFYIPGIWRFEKWLGVFGKKENQRPTQKTLQMLYDIYESPNEKLFKLLEREIVAWKNDSKNG